MNFHFTLEKHHHQLAAVHYLVLYRSVAFRMQPPPALLRKSSEHLVREHPTFRLPRRGLHSRGRLLQRLSVLQHIYPAHCQFNLLIFRDLSVNSIVWSNLILLKSTEFKYYPKKIFLLRFWLPSKRRCVVKVFVWWLRSFVAVDVMNPYILRHV